MVTQRNDGGPDLRDLFAGLALMGDWTSQIMETGYWPNDIDINTMTERARVYYLMADAMLAARERT